ncbi:hypothetical protein HAN_3g440 (nucleomorph) [Hemiselmis andersenii]|uniref:HMG box domain-containing protein n=1 Tax=Hemiselmis andersenii TaxID=464988 RepID=A9BL60_HEMAN|nr:hypothetical protein HAN_3g440 [Hemiselmis andersenii]ABW98243.1 hypothetical protein HAN_3g440 [Hemiselmis andersenii]
MENSELKKKKEKTPYQEYMKNNVPKLKAIHQNLSHKEIFRLSALNWKDAIENPKNQK